MAGITKILWQKELVNRKLVYVNIFDEHDDCLLRSQLCNGMNINSNEVPFSKDNLASMAIALQANKTLEDYGDLEKALNQTNKSICLAVPGFEENAIAHVLRANLFLLLKQYSLCLGDIELAGHNRYPPDMWPTLVKLKEKCLKAMDEADPGDSWPEAEPELSFPADANIPCFAEGLEVKHSKRYGKHIITTKDFEIGQTVIVEEAYCIASENAQNYSQHAQIVSNAMPI